jgi:hypothetical protein
MKNIFWYLTFCILFFGCDFMAPKPEKSAEEQLAHIHKLEKEMRALEQLDTSLAREMQTAYSTYLQTFPEDTLVPIFIKKKGDLWAAESPQSQKALSQYQILVEDYPEHPQSPMALMAASFVYEAQGDKIRQAGAYRMFLKRYPNHPLASDAKNLLNMITQTNQTDLQRVLEWKRKAQADTNLKSQ